MTKKEIQDILGENIQLYGLMTYFANDSKRQALENTYSNARIKKDNAERRLNQFIEQIKWNLQGPSAFLLSLIVGYILFKKIITIKSTFWFIVLLLITGFILAPMIRKYAYNLAKSSVLKKHPDLKEELESAEEKAAYYKKSYRSL